MSPEQQKQTTDWLIAIGAIALPIITVILSVLTVFQDKIRAWIFKPKLSVSIGGHTKTPLRVSETITTPQDKNLVTAYSFYLLIHNNGKSKSLLRLFISNRQMTLIKKLKLFRIEIFIGQEQMKCSLRRFRPECSGNAN